MRIVLLCGPPCSGKTTLAHRVAQPGDVVLDYDDIARSLGSPVLWSHPEPWRTKAEHLMQGSIAQASSAHVDGTAWVIRTAPRPTQRARLAAQWDEQECRRRAVADGRPSGTRRSIGEWYHRYRPWRGDREPRELDGQCASVEPEMLVIDPRLV